MTKFSFNIQLYFLLFCHNMTHINTEHKRLYNYNESVFSVFILFILCGSSHSLILIVIFFLIVWEWAELKPKPIQIDFLLLSKTKTKLYVPSLIKTRTITKKIFCSPALRLKMTEAPSNGVHNDYFNYNI